MIRSLFGRPKQEVALGVVTSNTGGAVPVAGLNGGSNGYDSVPAGFPDYLAEGSSIVVVFANGDPQRPQGLGMGGYVVPTS